MLGCLSGMTTPRIMLNDRRRSFHLEQPIGMAESAAWPFHESFGNHARMELLVSHS